MATDLRFHFQLARDVHQGSETEIAQSSAALVEKFGTLELREVLRLLHLFFGFPLLVRAWNAALPALESHGSAAPTNAKSEIDAEPNAHHPERGLETFNFLYGEQSEPVLNHLHRLDPLFQQWILRHAYGTVLARPHLSVECKERLAVLCLAATQCWKQWQSHVSIALRHGVDLQSLREDCKAVSWLNKKTIRHALSELKRR